MTNKNIFIGTIMKCLDVYHYNKSGDKYYSPSFSIGSMEVGEDVSTVDVYKENVILLRTSSGGYVELDDIESIFDKIKYSFSLSDYLVTRPHHDGDLFVKKESLIPYFNEKEKNISISKVKRKVLTDVRIKGGIEH